MSRDRAVKHGLPQRFTYLVPCCFFVLANDLGWWYIIQLPFTVDTSLISKGRATQQPREVADGVLPSVHPK